MEWRLLDKTLCTKIIPYLAFICELWCVYHDALDCWRMEWYWSKCQPCHAARLGVLENFAQRIYSWSYSFLGLSLLLKCITLPKLAFILPYLCRWLKWSLVGKMKAHACIIHVARSKIGSIVIILIFTSWLGRCTYGYGLLSWLTLFSFIFLGSCFFGMPSFLFLLFLFLVILLRHTIFSLSFF